MRVTNTASDLAAPIFALSVNINVNAQGTIAIGDLAKTVYSMFNATVTNMKLIGQLATGNAVDGNCNQLFDLRLLWR